MLKKKMELLLNKEMDRKEFLQYVGLATISLIGAPALFSVLNKVSAPVDPASYGYGRSPYGR